MYFNLKWSDWGLLDRAESREIGLPKQKRKKNKPLGKGFEIEK